MGMAWSRGGVRGEEAEWCGYFSDVDLGAEDRGAGSWQMRISATSEGQDSWWWSGRAVRLLFAAGVAREEGASFGELVEAWSGSHRWPVQGLVQGSSSGRSRLRRAAWCAGSSPDGPGLQEQRGGY